MITKITNEHELKRVILGYYNRMTGNLQQTTDIHHRRAILQSMGEAVGWYSSVFGGKVAIRLAEKLMKNLRFIVKLPGDVEALRSQCEAIKSKGGKPMDMPPLPKWWDGGKPEGIMAALMKVHGRLQYCAMNFLQTSAMPSLLVEIMSGHSADEVKAQICYSMRRSGSLLSLFADELTEPLDSAIRDSPTLTEGMEPSEENGWQRREPITTFDGWVKGLAADIDKVTEKLPENLKIENAYCEVGTGDYLLSDDEEIEG